MKLLGNRKSKKQKLSQRYNIQKRIKEHKRRVKMEAKKLGLKKKVRKDPGIPNSLPWKAELLADIEKKKERRDEELVQKRAEAKKKAKEDRETMTKESQEAHREREAARRAKRAENVELSQLDALRRILLKADVLVQALDSRDPIGCRCPELEAWVKENGKRLIFVLTKADLVPPQQSAQWIQVLGQVGPSVSVQVEAGGEGVAELVQMLGHSPSASSSSTGSASAKAAAPAEAVGVVGYPGTGKRSLLKAIRREVTGASKWLMEVSGRLRVAEDLEGQEAARFSLHLAMRGMFGKGGGAGQSGPLPAPPGDQALTVVTSLMEQLGPQALMRRYRLPAFQKTEGFLEAWVQSTNAKTKKGKVPGLEASAQRYLTELATIPGFSSAPPSELPAGGTMQWEQHSAARPVIEQLMKAQLQLLLSRDSSSHPAAKGLTLPSGGLGPGVALKELMEGEQAGGEDDDEMGWYEAGEGEEGGWEEGEEEEEFEDDDDMEDDV